MSDRKSFRAAFSVHYFRPQQLAACPQFIMAFRSDINHLFDADGNDVLGIGWPGIQELHLFRPNREGELFAERASANNPKFTDRRTHRRAILARLAELRFETAA